MKKNKAKKGDDGLNFGEYLIAVFAIAVFMVGAAVLFRWVAESAIPFAVAPWVNQGREELPSITVYQWESIFATTTEPDKGFIRVLPDCQGF